MSDTPENSDHSPEYAAEQAEPRRIVVLISGNGTNLQALIDAQETEELGGEIAAVISNRGDAYGLVRAREAGIPAVVLPHHEYDSRERYDSALIKVIDRHAPDLIVLAGFMRILTPLLVQRYHGRMVNIHPSLLPAYRGLHTHQRALDEGVSEHGASVHFVTEELDGGPLIVQAAVPVMPGDTVEQLAERVQTREHLIYPMVIRWFLEGRLQLADDRPQLDGHPLPMTGLRLAAEDVSEEDL
ncbi:phosphoribosylglycinamide formyltransferase [Kushneria phosphatilytica]|uniref:Phosphoribosylglycinamide formyltransferase n=1 Tax=Kushneria phosphatilytica TaxID=657387 RepID=A0A1S1NXC9_9GAMM|nr:phosphoribosylglycinamide formyltransferase [Kushneria phosphatilytica]OHV12087.1 phosphoribosylglycinamide formyltransferase [Kushneria phosphatilytica]QEL11280.1 phosphoribosylglycinamide formyltransferase [Kushneria phosphatilytica]